MSFDNQKFKVGDFTINPKLNEAEGGDGETIPVRRRVIELLAMLASAYPEPVSRQRLIDALWEGNGYTGSRGITDSVFEARQILGDDSQEPHLHPHGAQGGVSTPFQAGTGVEQTLAATARLDRGRGGGRPLTRDRPGGHRFIAATFTFS